jgi:ATP-dependent Clp protease adaptor protein ClpS
MVKKSDKHAENLPVKDVQADTDEALVLEKRAQRMLPPQMYQVLMLNDDYTPMEFVVTIIQDFFAKDLAAATRIMLKIHLEGKGVCGIYPRDIAATKVHRVMDAASQAGHPLQCVCEPAGT